MINKENSKKRKRIADKALYISIWVFAILALLIMLSITGYIVLNGITGMSLKFLSSLQPMIITTILIIIISILIAGPIGIASAVYLVEYAKQGKIINCIRFAIEILAGIPSILYGLFGYIFFFVTLRLGMSIISGSLTLSIMIIPTIVRTTEEALKSVPNAYREGSLALGASKFTTIRKIVVPAAIPGILTAVILSIGRIIGETAAVYLTVGMVARIPLSIFDSGRTLAVHLYILAKEGISFEDAYATATILLVIVAIVNFTANYIASRIKRASLGKG